MNNQCTICSKNCLLSNLQCEKGQKYFQQDLTNKLIKCGHILTHKTGKKRSQENILEILLKHKEISQRELQEILDIEAGSMSEIIAKLEQREYIKRYKDERDKRRYIISLTKKGYEKITNKKTNDEDMFDMLSTEEQIQLNDMLNTLLKEWYIRHMKYQK